ncbi:hypothetical protein TIFTF001_020744 [Ficus carica]|uniref:Ubiquitin thioesterase OTU n=1 Tax=Ficus carica TaxID=3494 RepID=A0AA88AUC5_FICCA|nr:hypothetical protein TIFTF001_020744 [Ficus carica]
MELASSLLQCAIELSILAEYYGREIAAYDIQTTRCDLYGQGNKYSERVMLIYDGLHYDALAISPFEEAPEEFDQTIFAILPDTTVGPAEGIALNFVKDQQSFRPRSQEKEIYGHCQLHFALWGMPDRSKRPEGGNRACTGDRPCQLPRIQMTERHKAVGKM